jgi:hypothetical protein
MKLRKLLAWSSMCLLAGCGGMDATEGAQEQEALGEPPMLGIQYANDAVQALARPAASGVMIFHGGKIMPTATTENIFWGTSWAQSSFVGDKITGLDTWSVGFSGSNYAKTSDEYTGTNGTVGATTRHLGHVVDTTKASGGNSTSKILAEVCKVITNPDPSGNGYYAVYTDVPRGNNGYCAYHSHGTCRGVGVQFAFFWAMDGDPGCDPKDTTTGHSQGLSALANVSAHELSEARSDPNSGGWFDASGQENGDKCAWTFNVPSVAFSNGSRWKLQGEWSNKAFNHVAGFNCYPNSSNQCGCLDGH